MSKAVEWSREFHGRSIVIERGRKKYVVIGYIDAIEYSPPNGSIRGNRTYRHEMGDYGPHRPRSSARPLLVADPATGDVLIIKGRSGLKFNPKLGLVG